MAHSRLSPVSSRIAVFILAATSAAVNAAVAARLLSYWRVLKWEADTEWEIPTEGWRIDSVKLIWAALVGYFAAGAAASCVGVLGVVNRSRSFTCFYRNYTVVDLCLSAFATVLLALASFRQGVRATMCEELALQPDLLRELDLGEIGLSPENCEQWFEHAVVAFVGVVAIILVVRLQFILTVTNFYKHLLRQKLFEHIDSDLLDVAIPFSDTPADDDLTPRRIYLLPARPRSNSMKDIVATTDDASPPFTSDLSDRKTRTSYSEQASKIGDVDIENNVVVYAPVPLESLTADEARELATHGTWVASPQSTSFSISQHSQPSHCGHRRRSTSQSSSSKSRRGGRHARAQSATEAWHAMSNVSSHHDEQLQSCRELRASRSRSNSVGKDGPIRLSSLPDEGLLPSYAEAAMGDHEVNDHVKT